MNNPINPKELKVLQQAHTLLSQNNAASANEILLNYNKPNKVSHHFWHLLSLSHAILGESKEALKPALLIVKDQPNNIEYLKLLGGIYHDLRDYEQAILIFNRALKINDRDYQTISNLANSLKETRQYEEAEKNYQLSLALQPNQPDALTNYGLLKQVNAKLDEAISLHRKSIQLAPNNVTALYNLAFALTEKGEHDAALQTYSKVIQFMPNHVRALCDIAHIYLKSNQAERTLPYLQHAVLIAPNDEQAHLNYGAAHNMMGNYDLAEASFNEALRVNPDNQTAQYYLAILRGDNSIASSPDKYVQELFDGYAETFDAQLIGKLHYKTPELIGNMVKKHIDTLKQYNILDLGCGTGLAGIHLEDISEHMIGIDLSSKMLKKAEARNIYDELVVSGIEQYFETHNFQPDIVVSADVFVYIGDISAIFDKVSKSLSPNGLFAFSTEDTKDAESFTLKSSGRYAHNENHIRSLADKNHFVFLDNQKTIIRYEANEPIHGQVYLLKK